MNDGIHRQRAERIKAPRGFSRWLVKTRDCPWTTTLPAGEWSLYREGEMESLHLESESQSNGGVGLDAKLEGP